jgi:hypothetical protein
LPADVRAGVLSILDAAAVVAALSTTFYRDADADSYGDPLDVTQACSAPAGYATNLDDLRRSQRQREPQRQGGTATAGRHRTALGTRVPPPGPSA